MSTPEDLRLDAMRELELDHEYFTHVELEQPDPDCPMCIEREAERATCDACSLPAAEGDTYCIGHARLMDYRPGGGIAANA